MLKARYGPLYTLWVMKIISKGKFKTLLCTHNLHTRFIWFPGALVAFSRSKPQKSVCFATSLPLSLPHALTMSESHVMELKVGTFQEAPVKCKGSQ